MFLACISLLGLSFFGFFPVLNQLSKLDIFEIFSSKTPYKFVGWFLIVNSILIALLWLNVILPPLFDGTIYPVELQHYTTLIVQGFDLGLLLPACFISGCLLIKGRASGYLYSTTYVIFLSVLMTALSAKIVAMAMDNVNVIPASFIIPVINIITIISAILMVRSIKTKNMLWL